MAKKKNATNNAAKAKAAKSREQQKKLDLTCENATIRYIKYAEKKNIIIQESVLVDIMTKWPDMIKIINPNSITPSVAEIVIRKNYTYFQFTGPMRGNVAVVITAIICNPINWQWVDTSIYNNKEFVWWAIDSGLIPEKYDYGYGNSFKPHDKLIQLVENTEEGIMCRLAKYPKTSCYNIFVQSNKEFLDSIYSNDMLNTAIYIIRRYKQPFSLMKDILRKRLLIARIFNESYQKLEIELAGHISSFLTISLTFYSILHGDYRYPRFRKKYRNKLFP